ncbi:MAG: choice-of-anchor J domain-containing protein [Muribaculaceae bacterium]|nr:choice-of-anchor J domain-containing protein [Muribaculaceae bacterium]
MKRIKSPLILGCLCLASQTGFALESIPYYNPGEDISTVTWVSDKGYANNWSIQPYGSGTQANNAFSYTPAVKTQTTDINGSTIFTKELDLKNGSVYKLTFVFGSWFTAPALQNYQKFNVALYNQPKYEYKVDPSLFTEIFVKEKGETFTATSRPSYTVYFKSDGTKRYLGFGNHGGGNVNRVGLDDINVIEVDVQTPDVVSNVKGSINGKDVTISFSLPTKTVVGDPLNSIQSVKILRDGALVTEFTNETPGKSLSFTDNVSVAGNYMYSIVCSNNGSDGEAILVSAAVPLGNSAQPPSITQEYGKDSSKVNSLYGYNYKAHAIYLPGQGIKIKYALPLTDYYVSQIPQGEDRTVATISRMSDGKKLVEGDESGEFIDNDIDESTRSAWQYKVDLQRYTNPATAYSSIVSLNNPLPFHPAVSSTGLYEFTIIDGDGDNSAWAYHSKIDDAHYHDGVFMSYKSSPPVSGNANGDNWLITPGLLVDKDKTYRVDATFFVNEFIEMPTQLEVVAGNSNTPEALTTSIMPAFKIKSMVPKVYSAYYNPEFSGNAFFGIHHFDCSGSLGMSDLKIYEVSGSLPEAIGSIDVQYKQPMGNATLSFTAPTLTIAGAQMSSLTKIELYRNKELIYTFRNPQAGQSLSHDVQFTLGSQDEFRLIPYTEAGPGLETSVFVMAIEPPYSNTFDSASDFTGFTVVDPQERGYTWSYMPLNKSVRSYPDREDGQDDYLITPPIHLEEGMYYRLDFSSWLDTEDTAEYYNNQLEVLLGTAPEVDGLNVKVLEPFYIRGSFNSKEAFKAWFTVDKTGEYYLAWHAIAEPYLGREIYLDDIKISDKIPGTYPGPVTNAVVAPDSEGALTAQITFNIPQNDLLGSPLASDVYKTVVLRDGNEIWTASNQKPGTAVSVDDSGITEGVHLYTITNYGYNSDSKMEIPTIDIDIKAFIGLNTPSWLPSVTAVENPDKYGEVTITWEAPATDKDGYPLNTSKIYYNVGHVNYNPVTGSTSYDDYVSAGLFENGLSYTVTMNPQNQQFMKFYVDALTKPHEETVHDGECAAGVGAYYENITKYMAVGNPYTLPFTESFPKSNSSHGMMGEELAGIAMWGFNTRNPQTGVNPVDGDGGIAIMEAAVATGSSARLYTGRIDLATDHPVLSLYLYNMSEGRYRDSNEFAVSVREGNDEFKEVARKSVDDWTDGIPGWHKITVDLSEYAHKVVYIGFEGVARRFYAYPNEEELLSFIHIDKVLIDEASEADAAVKAVSNTQAFVGTEHSVTVSVKNNAGKPIDNASLVLFMDGKEVETKTLSEVDPGELKAVVFSNIIGRDNLGTHKYSAEVTIDGDIDTLDNKAEGESFEVVENDYPTVTNLTATLKDNTVAVEWSAPNVPTTAQPITDDFEGYNAWSTMYTGIGNYTLVDGDDLPVGGFQDGGFPIEMGSKQSFTVWDIDYVDESGNKYFGADLRYTAFSGSKCLVSMYSYYTNYNVDDRLISPLLSGEAQTISFYAKALAHTYPENFQVYYSTDGVEFSDFQDNYFPLETATGDWMLYSYQLPEGARYFMIRHYSKGGYFFFIDDLTYTPQGLETLNLRGYRVYREGEKVNDAAATDLNWTDMAPDLDNGNTYGVSAVYDQGESQVETVTVAPSGVNMLESAGVKVYSEDGEILISGAQGEGYMVTSANGVVIAAGIAEDLTRISVNSGIYFVKVSDKTFKLAVR